MIPGRINGRSTNRRNKALPGNCARSSARAAGTPNVSEITIAVSATCRLLSTDSQMARQQTAFDTSPASDDAAGIRPLPRPLNE
jgi:hypothetical protein